MTFWIRFQSYFLRSLFYGPNFEEHLSRIGKFANDVPRNFCWRPTVYLMILSRIRMVISPLEITEIEYLP